MRRNETEQLKGIALILLFWHHLFGCGNFLMLEENEWIPCFGVYDALVGGGGKICIAIFAAVSGYGLYKSYISKNQKSYLVKRIGTFLITYWTMLFCIAIPYLIYFEKFNQKWMMINLFALLHNDQMLYLSLSWYVKVYLEILIFLPVVKYINSKIHTVHTEIFFFIILPLTVGLYLPDAEADFVSWKINILSSIKLLFTWYPVFHVGVLYAKYMIPEKYSEYMAACLQGKNSKNKFLNLIIPLLLMLYSILYRGRWLFGYYTDVICVAVFIILFDVCFKNGKAKYLPRFLSFIGKYSFQYWLVSGMFFLNTTEFQWILVLPKYSIFILLWKIFIITPMAIVMNTISKYICSLVWHRNQITEG